MTEKLICTDCGEEIREDQAVHGARTIPGTGKGLHWECYEKRPSTESLFDEIKKAERRAQEALSDLRKILK